MTRELTVADLPSILAACRLDPEVWFTHFGKIVKDDGTEVIGPMPTSVQSRMFAHYRRCRQAGRPCKMLIYKSRRHGASTGANALLYHHGQNHKLKLKVMGHKDESANDVFGLFKTLAQGDRFPWIEGVANVAKDTDDEVTLSSGTTMMKLSAQADEPGRGGAAQGAEITEVAHYKETGSKDPLTAFLQSVKAALNSPNGLIIADSTPAGALGWFYDMVCGERGVLEKKRNGSWTLDDWEFIFEPWWTLPDSTITFASQEEFDEFVRTFTQDETEEWDKWSAKGLTMEAMKWRRHVIDTLLKGDVDKFKQEYPSDPIEGFLGAGKPRFNMTTLLQCKDRAHSIVPEVGNIMLQDDGTASFIPDPRGELYVLEGPRWGHRYLVAMDTMTGEDQTEALGKHDPDCHAIHVLRDAYEDEGGVMHPIRVVARHGSQLDIVLAAEIARKISAWYGDCMVVPEVNNCGLTVVKYLEAAGCPVYSRRSLRGDTETHEKQLGWKTDPRTRKTIIDHLANEWRNGRVDIGFIEILDQMITFVSNKKGKPEALPGKKDDEVLALAIGVYNIAHATERKRPKRKIWGGANSPDSFRRAS